jgi:hypothetical protein
MDERENLPDREKIFCCLRHRVNKKIINNNKRRGSSSRDGETAVYM